MNNLSPESTIREVFEFFDAGQEGAQVVPVTVKQQQDDTQLCIFIKGEHTMASTIMAELMTKVEELFDLSQQSEAVADDKSAIITP